MPLIHLQLSGRVFQRGHQHGAALRREIHRLYGRWLACASRQVPAITERELLAFTSSHVDAAVSWAPNWTEEIRGIGDGSDLGFERAFALSCWDELCSWFAARSGQADGGRCTSFAVTGPGTIVIGQNQDAWTWWRPVVVLDEHDPTGETEDTICASHPGVLGTLGVNSCGIGLVANSLIPADRDVGTPFAVVMREVLAHRTLAEALAVLITAPRATGANYIIADEAAAIDVEVTHSAAHVEHVTGTFAHANHYLKDQLAELDVGAQLLPDTYLREARMRMLLASSGDRDVEAMIGCLSDHDGEPASICRHPAAGVDDMETLGAAIVVPGERALYLTDGAPCSAGRAKFGVAPSRATQEPQHE